MKLYNKILYLIFGLFALIFFGSVVTHISGCVDKTPPTEEPDSTVTDEGFDPIELPSETTGIIFNNPKDEALNDPRFRKSLYLNPLLDLKTANKIKIIYPNSATSWEQATSDPTIKEYRITPGTYISWGPLPNKSGKIYRYYDPLAIGPKQLNSVHPFKLKGTGREVIIEGFKFDGVKDIIVTGLTIRGQSGGKNGKAGGMKNAIFNSWNIIIDYCNFENVTVQGIRGSDISYCYFQNNVFQQYLKELNGDGGAIGITASRDSLSKFNVIVNNEIINYNDGFGFPFDGNKEGLSTDQTGDCMGTVFENNDIYITSLLHIIKGGLLYSCSENSFDFKNGTKFLNNPIKVIGNRCWGNLPSNPDCGPSGSNGACVSLHRNASNIIFSNNIFGDSIAIAFNILQEDKKFPGESMEGLKIDNNIIWSLTGGLQTGIIFANECLISNNTIKGGTGILISNDKASTMGIQKNLFLGTSGDTPSKYSTTNKFVTNVTTYKDYKYWRKRWTGPEEKVISKILKK